MKNCENVLKEYVRKLIDDDLKYLFFRCNQLLCGDRAEISEFLSQNRDLDRWLQSAASASELFDMLDLVSDAAKKEHSRRFEKNKEEI